MLEEVNRSNQSKRSNYPGSYKSRTLGKFGMDRMGRIVKGVGMSKTSKTRRLKELTGLTCLKELTGLTCLKERKGVAAQTSTDETNRDRRTRRTRQTHEIDA